MTNYEEELAKIDAELAALGEDVVEETKEDIQEQEEEKAEEVEEKESQPEEKEEKAEEVVEEKKEEKVDNAAYARLRWEAAENKRKYEELLKKQEEERTAPKQLPDKAENWEAYTEAKLETTEERLERLERELAEEKAKKQQANIIEQAKQEFDLYEQEFKTKAPDYEEARTFLVQNIARSVKILNPAATTQELVKAVEVALLTRGRDAVVSGINPAAAIYQEATQIGWSKAEQPKKESVRKPDLSKIGANKAKSAGMAGSGGGASTKESVEEALSMSNAELSRLTDADFERLEREAKGA